MLSSPRNLFMFTVLGVLVQGFTACVTDTDCGHCAGRCEDGGCVGTDCVPRFDELQAKFKLTLVRVGRDVRLNASNASLPATCRYPHDVWCRIIQSCCTLCTASSFSALFPTYLQARTAVQLPPPLVALLL
jgi:hypothetical protein